MYYTCIESERNSEKRERSGKDIKFYSQIFFLILIYLNFLKYLKYQTHTHTQDLVKRT